MYTYIRIYKLYICFNLKILNWVFCFLSFNVHVRPDSKVWVIEQKKNEEI